MSCDEMLADLRDRGAKIAVNVSQEAMMNWPYVWRRFKSRFKIRMLILAALLAVILLIRFALGGQ